MCWLSSCEIRQPTNTNFAICAFPLSYLYLFVCKERVQKMLRTQVESLALVAQAHMFMARGDGSWWVQWCQGYLDYDIPWLSQLQRMWSHRSWMVIRKGSDLSQCFDRGQQARCNWRAALNLDMANFTKSAQWRSCISIQQVESKWTNQSKSYQIQIKACRAMTLLWSSVAFLYLNLWTYWACVVLAAFGLKAYCVVCCQIVWFLKQPWPRWSWIRWSAKWKSHLVDFVLADTRNSGSMGFSGPRSYTVAIFSKVCQCNAEYGAKLCGLEDF